MCWPVILDLHLARGKSDFDLSIGITAAQFIYFDEFRFGHWERVSSIELGCPVQDLTVASPFSSEESTVPRQQSAEEELFAEGKSSAPLCSKYQYAKQGQSLARHFLE